jgi:hypothetical protein
MTTPLWQRPWLDGAREHYEEREDEDPPEDSHLESAYEDSINGGFDLDAFNPIDQGMYDEPDMDNYGGNYSEM